MPFFHDPYRPKANQPLDVDGEAAQTDSKPADNVPSGTTKEVLAWVDGDRDKAQQALDKEQSNNEPRKGLVRELNEVLNS